MIDSRPEAVTPERFPTAERICDSYENLGKYLEEDACYVVVTPDHKADLQCVSTILPTSYRYLGMIGSRKNSTDLKNGYTHDENWVDPREKTDRPTMKKGYTLER